MQSIEEQEGWAIEEQEEQREAVKILLILRLRGRERTERWGRKWRPRTLFRAPPHPPHKSQCPLKAIAQGRRRPRVG